MVFHRSVRLIIPRSVPEKKERERIFAFVRVSEKRKYRLFFFWNPLFSPPCCFQAKRLLPTCFFPGFRFQKAENLFFWTTLDTFLLFGRVFLGFWVLEEKDVRFPGSNSRAPAGPKGGPSSSTLGSATPRSSRFGPSPGMHSPRSV